jgi:molybdopterin-guanine dinucleotide biosynthesis protein A
MEQLANVTLGILCGGRSQRFGSDKGLYRPDTASSLVVSAIERLAPGFSETIVIVHDEAQRELYEAELAEHLPIDALGHVRVVADRDYYQDPVRAALTGIAVGLQAIDTPYLLATAVDQIRIEHTDVAILCSNITALLSLPHHPAVAYLDPYQGGIMPLPSLWPRRGLPKVQALIREGIYELRATLENMSVIQFDPGRAFERIKSNANRKADLTPASTSRSAMDELREALWPISRT